MATKESCRDAETAGRNIVALYDCYHIQSNTDGGTVIVREIHGNRTILHVLEIGIIRNRDN